MNRALKRFIDITKESRRATRRCRVLLLFLTCLSFSAKGQIKKYPADISPILGQPYSIFLSDYATPGSNNLSANIVFNDFHEAAWNFRLRIKIESSQVKLETFPGYKPQAPITVSPGIVRTFSGADWEEYFNYDHLIVSGISVNDLISSGGKLPEGFYSFCFQVLDYDTGDPLSEEICRTAWIKLMDPPRLNLPLCGINIDPKLTQHPFTWQLFDTSSPNTGIGTDFQLTIWEITDRTAGVQTAVANGQALQIFQSPILHQATYSYGLSDPPLELGKKYVYRVQAIDPLGKDKFKNQGFSEFCYFYYGWPLGGRVALKFPIEGGGFRKKDIPYVSWSPADTQLPGQQVSYEINVVPMNDGQTKEQAITTNPPWFYYNTPPSTTNYARSQQIDQTLEVMRKYAWQVKAFTDQQEIGKSPVSYFNGPSLMENFWANVHRVAVDYIDGTNLNDISGEGRIRLKPEADAWTPVRFEHIQLQNMGDFYVMVGGEFFYTPQNLSIELTANTERNGKAYFDVARFRINKDGIYAEGLVRWPLPIPTLSTGIATVKSDKLWANYNNFTINTAARIAEGNEFRLLEPFNFKLNLSKSGLIYIFNNEYRFDLNGIIELPANVKGPMPGVVQLPFREAEQLFYLEQDSIGTGHTIAPLAKSRVEVLTKKYVVDFSEEESPGKFQNDLRWKGIYLENFDLLLNTSLDGNGQFDVVQQVVSSVVQPVTHETDAWVTSSGLNLKLDLNFPDSTDMRFQTFPSMLNKLRLEVAESQIVAEHSYLKGGFLIPVISNTNKFLFTVPINNLGFQDGYLENLVNTKFVHNAGSGDQEIKITVTRAVLSGYERIGMTLDLEWPSIGITLNGLRGFNVWGDYSIGFDSKNGTVPLTQRYNATLSGYPITIGVIGAGSNDGNYIFATTSDAVMGDDVSGGGGVPSINVYSVSANPLVPKNAPGQVVVSTTKQIPLQQASSTVSKDYTDLQQNLMQRTEVDQDQLIGSAEDLQKGMGSTAKQYAAEDMVGGSSDQFPGEVGQGAQPVEDGKFNSRQQEIIYEIAAGFVEEMAKPILDPVKHKTDSLSIAITNSVNGLIDQASVVVNANVRKLVMELASKLAEALKNDKINVGPPILAMGDKTSQRISQEIIASLHLTAQENIIDPINVLLKDQINGRINKHITVNGTKIVYESITGDRGNAEEALKQLIEGTPAVLKAIIKDVAAFVSVENIRSTLDATASDFVKNINMSEVGHDLRKIGEDIIKEEVNRALNQAVSKLAEKYAEDLGLGGFGIGGENPINFVGVAERFSKGDIKGVFAIDPVRVRLKTPVIDLDGFMNYTPKHPVYGDVWLGDIDMTIKVPKKFAFNAIYFNGRKDDVSYWFCQLTPPGGENTPYQLGKPLTKAAKPLKDPVNIGIAKIVGASGRLYHHMKETPGNGIVPDAGMRYGAYMHFVFFDKGTDGKNLRLEVSGEINSSENGDYTIAFDGNLQTRSKSPQVMEIDQSAAVQGTVMIRYNSAEEHFLGYARVVVKTSSLCADASLLVDVKPGKWRIAIGSREERIVFVPGCAGWSPTGWLDINQNEAELGLGVQYSGKAKSPDINLGLVEFNIEVDAGFAFGILAVIQYNPTFALMRAGVWVDMWANIIANYKFPFKSWKHIVLVEIFIRGDLVIIFNPPPTVLEGNLNGHVKVLCFSMNFKAHMKKEI
jgi:hypothetical protein